MNIKIFSIKQFVEKHPFLTENSIRWMLFKDEPGLEECLIRNSRRIFIIEDAFMDFLMEKSKNYKEIKGLKKSEKAIPGKSKNETA